MLFTATLRCCPVLWYVHGVHSAPNNEAGGACVLCRECVTSVHLVCVSRHLRYMYSPEHSTVQT